MEPIYEPKTLAQKIAYLTEEAGEVLAAIGKSGRWGLDASNPDLPLARREMNGDWLLREMRDLEGALARLRPALIAEMSAIDGKARS